MKASPATFHHMAFASSATATQARPMPSARAPGAINMDWPPASDCAKADSEAPRRSTRARETVAMRLILEPPSDEKRGTPGRPERTLIISKKRVRVKLRGSRVHWVRRARPMEEAFAPDGDSAVTLNKYTPMATFSPTESRPFQGM